MPRLARSIVVSLAAAAFSIGALASESLPAQSSSVSGVTLKVTPRGLKASTWEFDLTFDTHSQDLKDDLLRSAVLVAGGAQAAPLAWEGDSPGGHHRKGVLRFAAPTPRPAMIELHVSRPGESKPRIYRWRLQ
jgi:hypothetical protein